MGFLCEIHSPYHVHSMNFSTRAVEHEYPSYAKRWAAYPAHQYRFFYSNEIHNNNLVLIKRKYLYSTSVDYIKLASKFSSRASWDLQKFKLWSDGYHTQAKSSYLRGYWIHKIIAIILYKLLILFKLLNSLRLLYSYSLNIYFQIGDVRT